MLVVRVLQHLYLTKRNSIGCFYVVCGVMVRPTCDVLYQLQGGVWEVVGLLPVIRQLLTLSHHDDVPCSLLAHAFYVIMWSMDDSFHSP